MSESATSPAATMAAEEVKTESVSAPAPVSAPEPAQNVSAAPLPEQETGPAPAVATEDPLATALRYVRLVPDVSQCSVKRIRDVVLQEHGVDLSHIDKSTLIQAVATTIAESAPVKDGEGGSDSEDDGDNDSDDSDDSDDEDPDVAALPEEFKSRFGEIVWVYSCKIWWPSFIFHPGNLSRRSELGKRAFRNLGKDYCCYFYGTSGNAEFGFARDKDIRPFDPTDTAAVEKYSKQKMPKRYQAIYEAGLQLAMEELKLQPEDRVAWKHPPRKPRAKRTAKKKAQPQAAAAAAAATPSAKKAKVASKGTKPRPKKMVAEDKGEGGEGDADKVKEVAAVSSSTGSTVPSGSPLSPKKKKIVIEEEEEEEEEEEPSDDDDESDAEFGETRPKSKSKSKAKKEAEQKLHRDKDKGKRSREGGGSSSSSDDRPAGKKARVDGDSKPKPKEKKPAPSATAAPAPGKALVEETPKQRAARLVMLLGISSAVVPPTAESSGKTVKTLAKLRDIQLTLDELKATGAAEAVMGLRKHADASIAAAARQLRDHWKEKFAAAAAAAAASAAAP